MQLSVKKYISELSKSLHFENLKGDIQKVFFDLKKMKSSIQPQAIRTLKESERKYNDLVKKIRIAQKQLIADKKKAKTLFRQSANEIDHLFKEYKKIATHEKNELKKTFSKGKEVPVKNVILHAKKTKRKIVKNQLAPPKLEKHLH